MSEERRFKVIQGGEKPKAGRSNKKHEPELLICKCGSSTTVETKVGRVVKRGRVSGGEKMIHCFYCKERLI